MMQITTRYTRQSERVDYWRAAVSRVFAPCRTRMMPTFRGSISSHNIGPIACHFVTASAHRTTRDLQDVAVHRNNAVVLSLMLAGKQYVSQDGREAELNRGDFAIHELARPCILNFGSDFTQYILQIPDALIRRHFGAFEYYTARKLSSDSGVGRLTWRFFTDLVHLNVPENSPVQQRLVDQAVDLLAMTIDDQIDGARSIGTSHRTALLYRAKLFIDNHLPEHVTGDDVARHLGISSRYVSSLFANEHSSVREYLLTRRLQQCRDALATPSQIHREISEIAFAWGFNSIAYFSRAFRARYGACPRDFRSTTASEHALLRSADP